MRQVGGLDVHKDSVFLCVVNENGVVYRDKFGVLTPELERMAGIMQEYGVHEACMESTSIYWMPVWRVLEPYVSLKLVNPFFIKQLPGKKSDVKDAEWIATCLLKGLISGSYVPGELIQRLRQYDRRIADLNVEITRKLGKLDAALQRCNIHISNYRRSRRRCRCLPGCRTSCVMGRPEAQKRRKRGEDKVHKDHSRQ